MLVFCKRIWLLIKYNEDSNIFRFHQLPVCKDIVSFNSYAYEQNEWITFKPTLPIPLCDCFGILNEDNTYIHIIGGSGNNSKVSVHLKTKVRVWDALQLVIYILKHNPFFKRKIFYYMNSKKEMKLVIQYWARVLEIKSGWIDYFNKMIIKYNINENIVKSIHDVLKVYVFGVGVNQVLCCKIFFLSKKLVFKFLFCGQTLEIFDKECSFILLLKRCFPFFFYEMENTRAKKTTLVSSAYVHFLP
ncbi:hypothetical protein RFI_00496 [Reticulomyxa filosa]|uniref:Uncharacterized protein n=1 Tax=Reticulomyxa filosa TaxID=46433 RepID=X6PEN5_RETFI|nr:hypothetical protein RFI_00496 [Reticulomyxa filosa]|eukprot:ETO36568.1 hypothetical protein RFI_00496 [Reticulomyxa filosa]